MWVTQSPLESLNEHRKMCLSFRRSGWQANNYGFFPPSLTKVITCKVQRILFIAHSMQVSPNMYMSLNKQAHIEMYYIRGGYLNLAHQTVNYFYLNLVSDTQTWHDCNMH